MSKGTLPARVIVLCRSLGNVPARWLAAVRPTAGLILVSPFTSLPGAIADHIGWPPFRVLPWPNNRFDVGLPLSHVTVPVAFIVSKTDGLVPLENARHLAAMSPTPVRWFEDDHAEQNGLLAPVAASGVLRRALDSVIEKNAP